MRYEISYSDFCKVFSGIAEPDTVHGIFFKENEKLFFPKNYG